MISKIASEHIILTKSYSYIQEKKMKKISYLSWGKIKTWPIILHCKGFLQSNTSVVVHWCLSRHVLSKWMHDESVALWVCFSHCKRKVVAMVKWHSCSMYSSRHGNYPDGTLKGYGCPIAPAISFLCGLILLIFLNSVEV